MAAEDKKLREAANLKTPGAAKAGEPDCWSDDGLAAGHEPKPKKLPKPWDPMNRKSHEEPRVNGSETLRTTSAAARTRTARWA